MSIYNNYAYIDGANLHYTYENIDWDVDYERLLVYLRKRLQVDIAYYYIGKTPNNEDLYTKLNSYGYTVRLKEPSPYIVTDDICPFCGKILRPAMQRYKADVDSFLTMQVTVDWDNFNKAVIISSDGDYDELVKRLLRHDKLKMVFAPCKSGCSWLLRSCARGRIAFIDDYKNEIQKFEE
jgi:uncharacterized LabA/DUF88 family protein